MSAEWMIDLAALFLMVLFGYLVYRVEKADISKPAAIPIDELLSDGDGGNKFSLYPSKLIRQCGLRPAKLQLHYWLAKLMLALILPLLILELSLGGLPGRILWTPAILGFFLPDAWLLLRRRKRRGEIANALGFFISLMVVYMRSGMTMAKAFRQAAEYGLSDSSPLAKEVELLALELDAGRDQDAAFSMLAARTGEPGTKRLAAVINLGYRAGSPIVETLKGQSEVLRAKQSQMTDQLVNKRSVEAMLPMMLISFPVFVALVLLPAALQLLDVLEMIGEMF